MKTKTRIAVLASTLLALSGCVTNKGWQGLIPDKDVEMVNPMLTITVPYGQQILRADRIATRIRRGGTNEAVLPPLAVVPPSDSELTLATLRALIQSVDEIRTSLTNRISLTNKISAPTAPTP